MMRAGIYGLYADIGELAQSGYVAGDILIG